MTLYRNPVRSLIVLTLLAIGCVVLLLFVKLPSTTLAWSAVQNVGHFFLFACLAIATIIQFERVLDWKFFQHGILTIVALTFIGVLAEVIQIFLPGRNASSGDIGRNFAGVTTGLICYATYHYKAPIYALVPITLLVVSIFLGICHPALQLVGYALLKSGAPSVVSFEDPFINSMISTTGGAKSTLVQLKGLKSATPQRALRMDFAQEPYNGVIMHETRGSWALTDKLALRIYNADDQTRTLKLRINDVLHNNRYEDRFNTNFYINAGENEVLIPVDKIRSLGGNSNIRFMDLQKISELQLFSDTRESFTLYLRGIWLTQQ